jgi:hypothetical protein
MVFLGESTIEATWPGQAEVQALLAPPRAELLELR